MYVYAYVHVYQAEVTPCLTSLPTQLAHSLLRTSTASLKYSPIHLLTLIKEALQQTNSDTNKKF